jgi:hypothetical protein
MKNYSAAIKSTYVPAGTLPHPDVTIGLFATGKLVLSYFPYSIHIVYDEQPNALSLALLDYYSFKQVKGTTIWKANYSYHACFMAYMIVGADMIDKEQAVVVDKCKKVTTWSPVDNFNERVAMLEQELTANCF